MHLYFHETCSLVCSVVSGPSLLLQSILRMPPNSVQVHPSAADVIKRVLSPVVSEVVVLKRDWGMFMTWARGLFEHNKVRAMVSNSRSCGWPSFGEPSELSFCAPLESTIDGTSKFFQDRHPETERTPGSSISFCRAHAGSHLQCPQLRDLEGEAGFLGRLWAEEF